MKVRKNDARTNAWMFTAITTEILRMIPTLSATGETFERTPSKLVEILKLQGIYRNKLTKYFFSDFHEIN